jgi:predicted aspartyl protease
MIVGIVQTGEARIGLTVRGAGGREREIEAVIDTGFTGSLTLPPPVIAALRLRWRKPTEASWRTAASVFSTCMKPMSFGTGKPSRCSSMKLTRLHWSA